jgi:hypothetical protein
MQQNGRQTKKQDEAQNDVLLVIRRRGPRQGSLGRRILKTEETQPVVPPAFAQYCRGDIFQSPEAWRAYLPQVVGTRLYDPQNNGACQTAASPEPRNQDIVVRQREVYVMPTCRPLPRGPCATDEAWLERCRFYARLMAQLVAFVQWQSVTENVHCDISAATVLMSDARMVLVDCANGIQPTRSCPLKPSGHLDSMAIDMLIGIEIPELAELQRPRHDLESVLYLFVNLLHEGMSMELRAATPMFDGGQNHIHTAAKQADSAAARQLKSFRTTQDLRRLGKDLVRRQPAFQGLRSLLFALDGLRGDGLCQKQDSSDSFSSENPEADVQNSDERFWILSSRMHDAFTAFAAA